MVITSPASYRLQGMSEHSACSSFEYLSLDDPGLVQEDADLDAKSSSWSAEAVVASETGSQAPTNDYSVTLEFAKIPHGRRGGLKLKSLLPLVLTLQESLVTIDDEHHLLGEVTASQLLKFLDFAACVDSVTIAESDMGERRVANATYMRIATLLEPQISPLFRSLTSLTTDYTESVRFYLPLFVTPTLRSFTFHGSGIGGLASLTSFISVIGEHGHLLSSLHLSNVVLKASLVEAISSCTHLSSVRLTNLSDEFESAEKVLALPHLKYLHVDCQDGINFRIAPAPNSQTSINTLKLSASSSTLLSILDHLVSNKDLKKLVISVISKEPFSFWYIFQHAILPIVESSKRTLKTLKVRGAPQYGDQNDCPPSDTIAKLARCSKIHTLQFTELFIRNAPQQFCKFPSFSTLTDLRLPISNRSNPLTNLELATLAVSCPELGYLQAILELPSFRRWSALNQSLSHAKPITFPQLLILSTGSNKLTESKSSLLPPLQVQDTCAMVHCFLMVFPALLGIKTHEEFFKEVWDGIKAMVELVRGQGEVNKRRSVSWSNEHL
ncbi:hypothetical protein CPB83DRAFT_892056 [Crepidotus variabilis]|uniref:Uncharacterized protein n=1 Tax=Crepidotus variabilis TaxID=179855 RepID=A0A9P6ELA2_9AGAR|nr:hypothetical protein CPB83DRAFT_892056 [Crepidotus variabilis]